MDNSYGYAAGAEFEGQINSRSVIKLRKSTKSTEENLTQCLYLTLQWSRGD